MFNKKKKIQAKNSSQVENYVLYLVSSKECSVKYIRDKIYSRFENASNYESAVIEKFIGWKYISDERFCEIYVRSKYNSFYGKTYIKQKLVYEHGITESMICNEFEKHDWFGSAKGYAEKLNIDYCSLDYKEKNKIKNKFARRGFSYDEIDYALSGE